VYGWLVIMHTTLLSAVIDGDNFSCHPVRVSVLRARRYSARSVIVVVVAREAIFGVSRGSASPLFRIPRRQETLLRVSGRSEKIQRVSGRSEKIQRVSRRQKEVLGISGRKAARVSTETFHVAIVSPPMLTSN